MVLGMWKRAVALLVAIVLVVGACTSDFDTPPDDSVVEGAVGAGSSCDDLDRALAAWGDAGFSGAVAVVGPGDERCTLGYGEADREAGTPMTPDTTFSIGSITKSVTAAGIYELVDAGLLSVDDRAGDLVPGLAGPVADVTVEQLLLHTSGLAGSIGGDQEPLSEEQAIENLSGLELAFEPGSDFEYSNAGYTLLALVIEQMSGQPYREHTADEVLGGEGGFWDGEPAAPGPRAVGYLDEGRSEVDGSFAGPHWAVDGNGSVAMTVPQLATWARALFEGELLTPESTEAITTPGFDDGDGTTETPGWLVFDESLFGAPFFGSAGGGGDLGHNAVVIWLPEQEQAVAMASNGPELIAEDLLQAVGPALVAGEPLPHPVASTDGVEAGDLAALAGTYQLESGSRYDVSVDEDGGGLAVAATGPDAVAALFPMPEQVSAGDVAAHEELVAALLAGETDVGRDELALLEEDLGPIDRVEVLGSVYEGELRTYVALDAEGGRTLAWYAVSDAGGIEAVELTDEPPTQHLVAADGGGFGIDDPTGLSPTVDVTFEDGTMTVGGSDDVLVADAVG